jgi:cellulose synthase/poly-beta-1,6-N-acetylglucosamine synthase-like glycosyltransferase
MNYWLELLAVCVAVTLYAYLLYPALLWTLSKVRRAPAIVRAEPAEWPRISITLPSYNAQDTLRPVLDALVAVEYPVDRRQILVVSDGSTDGTDDLIREYAPHGVELLRVEGRLGKTEVENRAFDALTGEIVVNTDSSVTVRPDAIKQLVATFQDPSVGVASARDVSVASVGAKGHASEAAYVGYEMWVRDLETAVSGIIGSSGCLYAVRAELHRRALPGHLSRDFSSALWARLNGYRAVSVRDAVCFVPRAASMQIEYRRKIRTMSRGIQTLFYHGRLLAPWRHGLFAWMLWSHKLIRWLVPGALVVGAVAAVAAAVLLPRARPDLAVLGYLTLVGVTAALVTAAVGWAWPPTAKAPRLAAVAAYFVSGTWAGIVAWKRALLDQRAPVWEPTPRALADSAKHQ